MTPVFVDYSLMPFQLKINYRNEFRYRPRNCFFSLKYGVLYRLGLDGFWRVSDDPL